MTVPASANFIIVVSIVVKKINPKTNTFINKINNSDIPVSGCFFIGQYDSILLHAGLLLAINKLQSLYNTLAPTFSSHSSWLTPTSFRSNPIDLAAALQQFFKQIKNLVRLETRPAPGFRYVDKVWDQAHQYQN